MTETSPPAPASTPPAPQDAFRAWRLWEEVISDREQPHAIKTAHIRSEDGLVVWAPVEDPKTGLVKLSERLNVEEPTTITVDFRGTKQGSMGRRRVKIMPTRQKTSTTHAAPPPDAVPVQIYHLLQQMLDHAKSTQTDAMRHMKEVTGEFLAAQKENLMSIAEIVKSNAEEYVETREEHSSEIDELKADLAATEKAAVDQVRIVTEQHQAEKDSIMKDAEALRKKIDQAEEDGEGGIIEGAVEMFIEHLAENFMGGDVEGSSDAD